MAFIDSYVTAYRIDETCFSKNNSREFGGPEMLLPSAEPAGKTLSALTFPIFYWQTVVEVCLDYKKLHVFNVYI